MSLPAIVEQLTSVRSGVTNVLQQGVTQWEIPIFPPNVTVTVISTAAPDYAVIGYRFHPTAMPNVFTFASRYAGFYAAAVLLSPDIIALGSDYLVFQTPQVSANLIITNNTGLNQYLLMNFYWLAAATEADFRYVLDVMAEYNGLAAWVREQERKAA